MEHDPFTFDELSIILHLSNLWVIPSGRLFAITELLAIPGIEAYLPRLFELGLRERVLVFFKRGFRAMADEPYLTKKVILEIGAAWVVYFDKLRRNRTTLRRHAVTTEFTFQPTPSLSQCPRYCRRRWSDVWQRFSVEWVYSSGWLSATQLEDMLKQQAFTPQGPLICDTCCVSVCDLFRTGLFLREEHLLQAAEQDVMEFEGLSGDSEPDF